MPLSRPQTSVDEVVRIEGARILATLIRTLGDVQLAEDAVQEATLAALHTWERLGTPPNPRAWLTITARRKAIDIIRRDRIRPIKEKDAAMVSQLADQDLEPDEVVRDDLLRLIFVCCHPTLSPQTRVALALRTLGGLSPAQIAGVLLTTESATMRRLTRARQKIAAAHITYRVPLPSELGDRLPAVCGVINSLYTVGHAPRDGSNAYDLNACAEALRLAELLHDLLPGEAMPTAVLALLLLTEARRASRLDHAGSVVTLDQQDRTRWDSALIARGIALLNESLCCTGHQADPYQLQAAIAAVHASATSYVLTDWTEIVRLYDLLLSVASSDEAALARAVAVAEAGSAATALALLADIAPSPRWHAVRAELLAREGLLEQAILEFTESLVGPITQPERSHRERRRELVANQMTRLTLGSGRDGV